jgi:type I restriction enzyme, S subunit
MKLASTNTITRLGNWIMNQPIVPVQDESALNQISLKDLKHDASALPIWKLAARISANVPAAEWEKVPSDLAQKFDDYQGLRDDS